MKNVTPRTDEYMHNSDVIGSPTKGKEPKKFYPRLTLKHEYFPEAKKWEVGKEYTVTLKLKMTGISISRFSNDSEVILDPK